jgi:hypothetical protein
MKENIYTSGTYLKNNPGWDADDVPYKVECINHIIKRNELSFNELIEVGCGAGDVLKNMALKYPALSSMKGYDISPQAIELAIKKNLPGIQFFQSDFLNIAEKKTDLLLVIDVLEHLQDFYQFLEKLRPRAAYFIFHIPLDISCRTLLKAHVLLQQRTAVGHIHYFSKEMVFWALEDSGYKITDWFYTKPIGDIKKTSSFKTGVKKLLRNFSFLLNQDKSAKCWGGYSLMILAK